MNGDSLVRHGTYYEGHMFPLFVKEQLDLWPEKHVRRRLWVSLIRISLMIPFPTILSSISSSDHNNGPTVLK